MRSVGKQVGIFKSWIKLVEIKIYGIFILSSFFPTTEINFKQNYIQLLVFSLYFSYLFWIPLSFLNQQGNISTKATNRCTLCSRFTDENESRTTVDAFLVFDFEACFYYVSGNLERRGTSFPVARNSPRPRSIFEDYPVSAVALLFRSRDLAQWSIFSVSFSHRGFKVSSSRLNWNCFVQFRARHQFIRKDSLKEKKVII